MVAHCCQIQFESSTLFETAFQTLFQTVFKFIFEMKIKSMFTFQIDIRNQIDLYFYLNIIFSLLS